MKKMCKKLLLIMPPQVGLIRGFSTGLISLANYVSQKNKDIDIELLDFSDSALSEVKREVIDKTKNPASQYIVGITTTTASYQSSLSVATIFKSIVSDCTVILGGHHASSDAEMILRNHADIIDFIVIGEGEKALIELLENLDTSAKFVTKGIAFIHNESFYQNHSPSLMSQLELDQLPVTFRGEGFLGTPGKFGHATYVSARGCPLKCAFCSVANERIRAKSVDRVLGDIQELVDKGFTRIAIEDNFFAHSPSRTKELCTALARLHQKGVPFSWDCQTRVESLAREGTIELLASAGCEAVYIGVESLNAKHLIYLNKTTNTEKYIYLLLNVVVPNLLKSPIDCYINLQLGIPKEAPEDLQETLKTLESLGRQAFENQKQITVFPQLHVVYPGTIHFQNGVLEERFPRDVFETFTTWEAKQEPVLKWLGKHFAHGTGGLPEGILNREKLKIGEYEVHANSVLQLEQTLEAIDKIEGISVFNYGSHIIENPSSRFGKIIHFNQRRIAV